MADRLRIFLCHDSADKEVVRDLCSGTWITSNISAEFRRWQSVDLFEQGRISSTFGAKTSKDKFHFRSTPTYQATACSRAALIAFRTVWDPYRM
jgi:hypothetical protein